MFDGLYCEFLKLKRTGYYINLLLIGGVCLYFGTLNRSMVSSLNWYGYFFKFEYIAFSIFYTFVIPNFIGSIFIREFKYETASIDFSYPNGRCKAFLNKFLISIIVIAIIYFTSYIFVVLKGFIVLKSPINLDALLNHFTVFMISFIFQVAILPIAILIALISKSIIVTSIYSLILLIGNVSYILGSKYSDFIYSIIPAAPVAKFKVAILDVPIPLNMVINNNEICTGTFIFLIGILGCVLFYRKANIY
ncbi:ABC transporter permease [Clostridium rectalis]|uniref:ABC transporter permease n=1 Tax=Clostridium rectalis TaxID=2040295 RepID=UPI000F63AEA6|nr:ABC transporter permease [Clostridium rectalis]